MGKHRKTAWHNETLNRAKTILTALLAELTTTKENN